MQVEEKLEKTRHFKNNDKRKNIFWKEKEIQDIITEFYLNQEKHNKNNIIGLYQKHHWPTFTFTFSSSLQGAFLAMSSPRSILFFKASRCRQFFHTTFMMVARQTQGYVLSSEPQALQQSLNSSQYHFCIYQWAIGDKI